MARFLIASRAAICVRLKRCSPKVAPLVCASPRTKSSTASRDEPTRSSSVPAAKDRTNSVAAAIRSAADGDCRIRSMPDGNVARWDAASQSARPRHGRGGYGETLGFQHRGIHRITGGPHGPRQLCAQRRRRIDGSLRGYKRSALAIHGLVDHADQRG